MARQFKIETTYSDDVITIIYWHDNDNIEFAAPPPQMNTTVFNQRSNMIQTFINFCKEQGIKKVKIDKISLLAKTEDEVEP